jgi:hypothetical protein
MKTKALLLTVAVTAVALATSMAQVFSVNVVGYVKLTIPAGKLQLLANPLNQPNNDLNIILPLKDDGSQDGVTIYRFDPVSGSYRNAIGWAGNGPGMGGVWLTADSDPNATVISPGEGFFVYNITGANVDLLFDGAVVQLPSCNPIPGNGALSIRASQIPLASNLGDPSEAGSLLFPAVEGMTVYVFDVATQSFGNAYGFFGTPGVGVLGTDYGWLHADTPTDFEGPLIPIAGSFFVLNPGPTVSWGCPNPPPVHVFGARMFSLDQ